MQCVATASMVVRNGDVLQRIGKMAELFDDHSLLQLQASGTFQGQAFTLVGRLQYKYAEGTWTEWHALLADGSSAFLSEDNGAYVFGKALATQVAMPPAEKFRVGATTAINGKSYAVASNQSVALISAQGELPRLPVLGAFFAMVELRSQQTAGASPGNPEGGEPGKQGGTTQRTASGAAQVVGIDYSTQPPAVSMGTAVLLDDLQLTGLQDGSAKDEKGRPFNCPNCGATLSLQLSTSKSITCTSCHSIIDVSQGIGGELSHALQAEPVNPLIPLGSQGQLQGVPWQVVGYQHRMGTAPTDPDEHFGWDEYLLYNAKRGFTFLVDSTDGWSIVKPATGAPVVSSNGQSATYLGERFQLKDTYRAETDYVVGEFYWQVQRGQVTQNRDYASSKNLLSMEQTASELTWSVGSRVESDTVAKAFKLDANKDLLVRSDASPVSFSGPGMGTIVVVVFLLVLFVMLSSRCSACDPQVENCSNNNSSYRTSGGSYGGYSGGGGHK